MVFLGTLITKKRLLFSPILPIKKTEGEVSFIDEGILIELSIPKRVLNTLSDRELIAMDLSIALIKRGKGKREFFYAGKISKATIQTPESYGIYITLEDKRHGAFYSSYGLSDKRDSIVMLDKRLYRTESISFNKRRKASFALLPYEKDFKFNHSIYQYSHYLKELSHVKYTLAIPRRSNIAKKRAKSEKESLLERATKLYEDSNERALYEYALLNPTHGEIYELYILLMLRFSLRKRGYTLIGKERIEYPQIHAIKIDNTFLYSKDDIQIVLYYEGFISSKRDETENSIELITKSSTATPDFIIKRNEKESSAYLIAEAKFKNAEKASVSLDDSWAYMNIEKINKEDTLYPPVIIYALDGGKKISDERLYGIYPGNENDLDRLLDIICN